MHKLVEKYEGFKAINSINKTEYIEEQLSKLKEKKKFAGFKEEMKRLKNKKGDKSELKDMKINTGILKKSKPKLRKK